MMDDHELPENLAAIADKYDTAVGIRDQFLWKWFHFLNPHFRLSTVDERYESKTQNEKTLLTFYVTLLDDLIDDQNDRVTFQEAAKIPFSHLRADNTRPGLDTECLAFAREVWGEFDRSLRTAPRYREFKELFEFDLQQTVNAVRYAYIVNNYPYTANMQEAYAYSSHNMVLLGFTDIDLMHSLRFNREEFTSLRSTIWSAQKMARIGNWVSTWQRELSEGDFTSGVLVSAYENGHISDDELRALWTNPTADVVEDVCDRIEQAGCRDDLIARWEQYRETIAEIPELQTVDLDRLLEGMETVMEYHLASEGMK